MKQLSVICLITFLSLFVGCNEMSAPVEISEDVSPQLMKPNSNGSEIIRIYNDSYVIITDSENDLILFIGVDPKEWICNFNGDFDEFESILVSQSPKDPNIWERVLVNKKGDELKAFLFNIPKPYIWNICDLEPIVTGIVKLNTNDNDCGSWDRYFKYAHTTSCRIQGIMHNSEGRKYHLNAVYKLLRKANWRQEEWKEFVKINLTEIGKN